MNFGRHRQVIDPVSRVKIFAAISFTEHGLAAKHSRSCGLSDFKSVWSFNKIKNPEQSRGNL